MVQRKSSRNLKQWCNIRLNAYKNERNAITFLSLSLTSINVTAFQALLYLTLNIKISNNSTLQLIIIISPAIKIELTFNYLVQAHKLSLNLTVGSFPAKIIPYR